MWLPGPLNLNSCNIRWVGREMFIIHASRGSEFEDLNFEDNDETFINNKY